MPYRKMRAAESKAFFFQRTASCQEGWEGRTQGISSFGIFKQGSFGKVYARKLKKWDLFPHPCLHTPGTIACTGASIPQPEDLCSKLMWFLRSKSLRGNEMPDIPRKVICSLLEESESFLVENTVVSLSGQVKVITWISSSLVDERDFNAPGP